MGVRGWVVKWDGKGGGGGGREARLGQVSRPNSLTGSGGARERDVKASSEVCQSGQ